MTDHPLPRANDDSAARLLLAEHAEERGDVRMARAWRWMAEKAKWPQVGAGWWWSWTWSDAFLSHSHCLPVRSGHPTLIPDNEHDCESAIADALERGDL